MILLLGCTSTTAVTTAHDETANPDDTGVLGEPADALSPLGTLPGLKHIQDLGLLDGDRVVMATYSGIAVALAEDPANPTLAEAGGPPLYWVEEGSDALASGREAGLYRVEISDEGFEIEARLDVEDDLNPEEASPLGDGVLLAAQASGLLSLDSNLVELDRLEESDNSIAVAVDGDVAWLGDRGQGLMAVDVSDPSALELLSVTPLSGSIQDVDIDGGVVVVGSSGEIHVLDGSDPTAPVLLSSIDGQGVATRVDLEGSRLAVANWLDLRLYSMEDPELPVLIAIEDAAEAIGAVELDGDTLWAGDWNTLRSFAIDVEARSPEITLPSSLLLFGDAPDSELVQVGNEGNMRLVVDDIVCGEGLQASPTTFQLAPGGSQLVEILAEMDGSEWEGSCIVTSNDADEASASIAVSVNPAGLALGDQAPDWEFPDLEGNVHRLSDTDGQVRLITLFSSL